jgi:hypothetical protein
MPHPLSCVIALAPRNQLPSRRVSFLVSQEQYDAHHLKYAIFHRAKSGAIMMRMAGWPRSRLLEDVLQVPPRPTDPLTLDFRPLPVVSVQELTNARH